MSAGSTLTPYPVPMGRLPGVDHEARATSCADAARSVERSLDRDDRIHDYRLRIRHAASPHPHEAVAVITNGVLGGLRA